MTAMMKNALSCNKQNYKNINPIQYTPFVDLTNEALMIISTGVAVLSSCSFAEKLPV